MRSRGWIFLAVFAAALAGAGVGALGAEGRPSAYCSPTGDFCYSAYHHSGRVYLELNAAARYFASIEICVTAPSGVTDCRSFPMRARPRTKAVRARAIWNSSFPDRGPGIYVVRFRHDVDLGAPVRFRAPRIPYLARGRVYVRNKPSGFVIGTLVTGGSVLVQERARGGRTGQPIWGFGLVGPEFGVWGGRRCGWLELSRLHAGAPGQRAGCPPGGRHLGENALFLKGSFKSGAGEGAVYPAAVKACPDPSAYGNYDPSTQAFATRWGAMPVGRGTSTWRGFGQRYVTRDGRAVMVKDTRNPAGAPTWFFMRRECIQRLRGRAR